MFFQSASSVEDKVQTVKAGGSDHQDTNNLNNELDLASSSSCSTVPLAVSRIFPGTVSVNANSTAVTGEILKLLELYRDASYFFLTHLRWQLLMFLGQIEAQEDHLPRVLVSLQ
jgi:hypothetical protein